MTDIPPSDPKSSSRTELGFDEFIAILVAFATIGAILFWSFYRKDSGWSLSGLPPVISTPSDTVGQNQDTNGSNLLSPSITATSSPNQATITPQTTQTPSQPLVAIPEENSLNSGDIQSPQAQVFLPPYANGMKTEPFGVVTPVQKMPAIPPAKSFTDIPSDFWAGAFIGALSSRKMVEGFEDNSFKPNQPVTRAEFAAILQKTFGKDIPNNQTSFKDVPANYWATKAINDSIGTGFLKGYPDKSFQPEQKISRVQVLVSLVTGLNLQTPSSPTKFLNIYKDTKEIPDYATEQVAAATQNGLVVNYPDPTALQPNKEATRAEVVAMIHQALVKMGKLPSSQSQYIVQPPS